MTVDEFFPDLPREGWPGRRTAIARHLFRAAVEGVMFVLILAAFCGVLVMVAAATDAL